MPHLADSFAGGAAATTRSTSTTKVPCCPSSWTPTRTARTSRALLRPATQILSSTASPQVRPGGLYAGGQRLALLLLPQGTDDADTLRTGLRGQEHTVLRAC